MLYHLGAVSRLNDFGLLSKLTTVSAVSGGSILSAMLATKWNLMDCDPQIAREMVLEPIEEALCKLAYPTGSLSVLAGLLARLYPPALKWHYRKLFGAITLAEIQDVPEFVFMATNLRTGSGWRLSSKQVRNSDVAELQGDFTSVPLATAVAASASSPQAPITLKMSSFDERKGKFRSLSRGLEDEAILADGSLAEHINLASLSSDDVLLVSDASAFCQPSARPERAQRNPANSVMNVADLQLYRSRKSQILDAFAAKTLRGAYWDIASKAEHMTDCLDCSETETAALAKVSTEFVSIDPTIQRSLIDWGFASCDIAIRAAFEEFRSNSPDASPHGTFYAKPPAASAVVSDTTPSAGTAVVSETKPPAATGVVSAA